MKYAKYARRYSIAVLVVFILVAFSSFSLAGEKPVKNVIFLMSDGTSSAHITVSRWYKGERLALDDILVGAVRTYSAESVISDSAPAATAFATGFKSNSKFISILPAKTSVPGVSKIADENKYRPVATVLEGARLRGKSVGLIATSNIQHASPAAFSAHTPFRDNYTQIAKQQVYGNIDVVFSAGKQYLAPKEQGGKRIDGVNLLDVLKDRGYAFVETRDDMMKVSKGKVWGLFGADTMVNDFDRKQLAPAEPSLAEMTRKAIELLSQNDKGFFLFVEASKVDWASHSNDPIGVISEVLAYDAAVRVALDFAKKDGQTLIVGCADHGNGGMAIGSKEVFKFYDKMPFERLIPPLKKAELSGEGMSELIGDDRSESNIRLMMMRHYGIDDLTAAEVEKIKTAGKGRNFAAVVGPMISSRSAIGWVYGAHTGEDIFLYAYGPGKPSGLIENTAIAKICAQGLGFKLEEIDKELFVPAKEAFAAIGASAEIDLSDENAPMLVVSKGLFRVVLPIDTNLIKIGKNVHQLPGLTVMIPQTKRVYIPRAAVEMAKAAGM